MNTNYNLIYPKKPHLVQLCSVTLHANRIYSLKLADMSLLTASHSHRLDTRTWSSIRARTWIRCRERRTMAI